MAKFLPFKEKTKKLFHCCYRHPPAFHLFPFAVCALKKERERCLAFCDGHVYPLIQIDILTKTFVFLILVIWLDSSLFVHWPVRYYLQKILLRMVLPPWPHPDKYHSTIWAFSKQVRDVLVASLRCFDFSVGSFSLVCGFAMVRRRLQTSRVQRDCWASVLVRFAAYKGQKAERNLPWCFFH